MSDREELDALRRMAELEAKANGAAPVAAPKPTSRLDALVNQTGQVGREARDFGAGLIRGAGSIGATLLYPVDAAARGLGVENSWIGRTDRRQAMTDGLQSAGADVNSLNFQGGKLGGEIAGTAGTGGVLAAGARGVGAAAPVVNALATGGMRTGLAAPTSFLPAVGQVGLRAGAGGLTGGTMAGLVDPELAGTGVALGALLPGATHIAGRSGQFLGDAARSGANRLMQSALKPTQTARQSGAADVAIRELLDRGISPTRGGVNQLQALIESGNTRLTDAIAGSTATVRSNELLRYLPDVERRFSQQVTPTKDLAAIREVGADFLATRPASIPVQDVQALKQGTYRILRDKYGQIGSAETEAQKAVARAAKDAVSDAVPEAAGLNNELSRLYTTLDVAERRALMEANKNPMGLAALAVTEPSAFVAFMADRSAAFKSLAARMLERTGQAGQRASQLLLEQGTNPLVRATRTDLLGAGQAGPQ
jgi:hypothetical protein